MCQTDLSRFDGLSPGTVELRRTLQGPQPPFTFRVYACSRSSFSTRSRREAEERRLCKVNQGLNRRRS